MLSLDMQMEIMKTLPVKSLIQFRSVCKAWKSLIDSSKFIADYNVRPDQPHHLMIRYEEGYGEQLQSKVNYVSFVDDDNFPQLKVAPTVPPILQLLDGSRIIDSSCGLLYCDGLFLEADNSKTRMAVLWNPSIRKSIAVVVPVPNVVSELFCSVVGFGVCPDTKDPKLVKITCIIDPSKMESISCIPCQVMVFTLSSGEWTCLCSNQLPRKYIHFDDRCQTVIGQLIYWVAYDWIDNVDGEPLDLIMSFHMSTKEFREVDLPDSLAKLHGKSDLLISRLRESLVVVEYNVLDHGPDLASQQVCSVWMMEHGDSKVFTKLFTINPQKVSVSRALAFRKSGEPIVEMQEDNPYFYAFCVLVGYEPCSKHIMELGIHGIGFSFYGTSYTESLLLLDHDDGHIVRCGAVKR